MPIPSKYKEIAIKISPFYRLFFVIFGVGIFFVVASILLSAKYQSNLSFLRGLGFLLFLWGWGLFLIINWFGKKSKFTEKLPKFVVFLLEWILAVFLDTWFTIGSIGIPLIIFSQR